MYDLCVIGQFLYSKDMSIINYLISETKEKILKEYGYSNHNIKLNKYDMASYGQQNKFEQEINI